MSCRDAVGVPCERSIRIAYSKLLHDDRSIFTWSAAVCLSFTMTPRPRRLVTHLGISPQVAFQGNASGRPRESELVHKVAYPGISDLSQPVLEYINAAG